MSLSLIGLQPFKNADHATAAGICTLVAIVEWVFLNLAIPTVLQDAVFATLFWYVFKISGNITYDGIRSVVLGPVVGLFCALILSLMYVWLN